jgi:hypothetical protein
MMRGSRRRVPRSRPPSPPPAAESGPLSPAEAERGHPRDRGRRLEHPGRSPDADAIDALRVRDRRSISSCSSTQPVGARRPSSGWRSGRSAGTSAASWCPTCLTLSRPGRARRSSLRWRRAAGPVLAQDDAGQQVRGVLEALLHRGTNLRRDSRRPGDRAPSDDPALPSCARSGGCRTRRPSRCRPRRASSRRCSPRSIPDPDAADPGGRG